MKIKGTLSSWQEDKGFGFITPDSDDSRVFVHISEFKRFSQQPVIDQDIIYRLTKDKQGRPCAKISKIDGIKHQQHKSGNNRIFIALIFFAIVAKSFYSGNIPAFVLGYYITLSVITFLFYAIDKLSAKKGWQRTPEGSLHILSIIGGWPGAIFAQQLLRHKTQKRAFRNKFWITVFINIGIFSWLHTPQGSIELQSWVAHLQDGLNVQKESAMSLVNELLRQWRSLR